MAFYNEESCESEEKCDADCGTTLTEDIPIMCWVSKDKEEKTVCRTCYDDCGYKETDTNSDNKPEEEEEEEDKYEFYDYGFNKVYKVVIMVAGGGMGNGNAYATVEGEWACEDDFNNGEDGEIYYCEYGSYPKKDYRGNRLIFSDEGTGFNIE